MVRRRPLGIGLGLAAAYLLAAVATMVLSDRPFRPLFDGLAPPLPYHWVNPPPANARDNVAPSAARREVLLSADGSPFVNLTPEDGQAILLLEEKAIAPNPPDTAVDLAVTPRDVLTLGPLPENRSPESNAYQVEATYRPSGQPVTDFDLDTSSIAVVAAGPSDFLLYSRDGQSWDERSTTPYSAHGLETAFAGHGYYVVTSISGDAGGGSSPLVVGLVLLAPPLIVGGLVLRSRRAKTAAAAKAAAKAAKRRGPPPKGGQKSNRPRR